ncbi:MAG: ATP-binding domain-containing protein [Bacteroidales bacterium]|nr:ATP-binding domain-containing protein [Bacteroidales bacterium]
MALNIVRGDLKNKPVSSRRLARFFEEVKDYYEGTLYIGYPIIGTSNGGYQIDALLVTKEKGLVVFNIEEGVNSYPDYSDVQDENFTKLTSKLIQNSELTSKRKLVVEINTVTYCPAWNIKGFQPKEGYPCIITDAEMKSYLETLSWDRNEYYSKLLSILQSITTIRRSTPRDYVKQPNSRGAILKKLEDSIANLDRLQSSAVIETVEGVQRIRGLAGSGKTIVLALKVAYLHAKNPDWKIAVTFNSRSLKEQFKRFITQFSYENINDEPNWKNIDIIHAWGTSSVEGGVYFNFCKDHNIEFVDFIGAKKLTTVYGKEFDIVCEKALREVKEFFPKYDLIVIDEAQDFSKEFIRICYNILKEPKRLVYAYDELQSLNTKTMESPEVIFGNDELGKPLVNLINKSFEAKQDIILYKCYRNSLEILTAAHALGFGIYNGNIVQMFDNSTLWNDIGYRVIEGELVDGKDVVLKRSSDTSPDFLSNHSEVDDLIIFKSFKDNDKQINYIVDQIEKNINKDELRPEDIMVINPDPLTTKTVVGLFRQKLFDRGINSTLAGVSTSPDIFTQSDSVTFTGIYRAKGNEASMVYVINSQYCYNGLELAKKRNMLFTAMTRSKAWVRVCGYGDKMDELVKEYNQVLKHSFSLSFKYPTEPERNHMNLVNRDMSTQEKGRIQKNMTNLKELIRDLNEGRIQKEDLSDELINDLRKIILK